MPDVIFDRLAKLIAETFQCQLSEVTRDAVALDIDGWDSLSHTILMVRIEEAYGIKFDDADYAGLANVGELADRIVTLKAGTN